LGSFWLAFEDTNPGSIDQLVFYSGDTGDTLDQLVKSRKATHSVIAPWRYPDGSSTYWIPAFAGMTLNGLFAIPSTIRRYDFLIPGERA
jgi:hypothetical protein